MLAEGKSRRSDTAYVMIGECGTYNNNAAFRGGTEPYHYSPLKQDQGIISNRSNKEVTAEFDSLGKGIILKCRRKPWQAKRVTHKTNHNDIERSVGLPFYFTFLTVARTYFKHFPSIRRIRAIRQTITVTFFDKRSTHMRNETGDQRPRSTQRLHAHINNLPF